MRKKKAAESPFALEKEKGSSKKAILGLILFFLFTLALFSFAIHKAFVKTRLPSVLIFIDRTKPLEKLITPQPPSQISQKKQDQGHGLEADEEEFIALTEEKEPVNDTKLEDGFSNLTEEESLPSDLLRKEQPQPQQEPPSPPSETLPPSLPLTATVVEEKQVPAVPEVVPPAVKESAPPFVRQALPKPDLVQGTLMRSLPSFAAAKIAKPHKSPVPLQFISPLLDLRAESKFGFLPNVAKDKRTPFQVYSRPYLEKIKTAYVAVMFVGVGVRKNTTQATLNALPSEVSLSISPYSENLPEVFTSARKGGHETYLELPMQKGPFPETDPGPLGLVSGLPPEENRARFYKTLASDAAFSGVVASAQETFSQNNEQMTKLIDEIYKRGLVYIDGTDDLSIPRLPKAIRPDVLIADNFYRSALKARLEDAKQIALRTGKVFIRVETTPIAILTVLEWINSVTTSTEEEPAILTLVPVSYYVKEALSE